MENLLAVHIGFEEVGVVGVGDDQGLHGVHVGGSGEGVMAGGGGRGLGLGRVEAGDSVGV